MKKRLLAVALSLAATTVYAEPTAMLKVHGTLTSGGCVPELSNGGTADFGDVSLNSLSSSTPYQAGYKDVTLTINCQSATRVGWSIQDDRADSSAGAHASASEFYVENGTSNGKNASGPMLSGVGKTSAGENIGAYAVSTYLSSITADGASAHAIAVDTMTTGGTIGKYDWMDMWSSGIINGGTTVMTLSKSGERSPMAFNTAVFPLKIALAIAPTKNLTLTDKTELDGQSTITLVYL